MMLHFEKALDTKLGDESRVTLVGTDQANCRFLGYSTGLGMNRCRQSRVEALSTGGPHSQFQARYQQSKRI
jgi:hypothetical protein